MGQTAGDEGQKTGDSDPLSASAAYDGDSRAARHRPARLLGAASGDVPAGVVE
jgi:hypothetical protein